MLWIFFLLSYSQRTQWTEAKITNAFGTKSIGTVHLLDHKEICKIKKLKVFSLVFVSNSIHPSLTADCGGLFFFFFFFFNVESRGCLATSALFAASVWLNVWEPSIIQMKEESKLNLPQRSSLQSDGWFVVTHAETEVCVLVRVCVKNEEECYL